MTIADKLSYLMGTKAAIKQALLDKGITVSDSDTFRSYASKIDAIVTPSLTTLSVTPTNSPQTFTPSYPYNGYSQVTVGAATGGSVTELLVGDIDASGVLSPAGSGTYTGDIVFSGVKSFTGNYTLCRAFQGGNATSTTNTIRKIIGAASFPDLVSANSSNCLAYAFSGQSLTGVSFPKLETVNGSSAMDNMVQGCTGLTSLVFPLLKSVANNAMQRMCRNCTSLTNILFPSLEDATALNSVGAMTNMLAGVTGCTVHFPAAIETTIENETNVTAGFGGTNTVILYDL